MVSDEELRRQLYNAFDPFQPLPAGDPAYVDCQAVRGDLDIRTEIGQQIVLSAQMTCSLYAGHWGAGKSTELRRLQQYLDGKRFFVVYFAADDDDIDPEDAAYADILLACTRHLLQELKDADPSPVLGWLGDRWNDFKDLAQTKVEFDQLSVDAQISQIVKLSTNVRAVPSLREDIRKQVNRHTVTLIDALNEFIKDAKRKLPLQKDELVVIVDNLDRIVPVMQESKQSNHEEIFIERHNQLRALNCHLVYTVPISLLYSKRASDLRERYTDTDILPMVKVQERDGTLYEPGFAKIKEVLQKRVEPIMGEGTLETQVFDSPETVQRLCLTSGGHIRNLILLMRGALSYASELPISRRAVQRAISQAQDTYRRTVQADQWRILAKVARDTDIENDDAHRELLFNRCLLQYCDVEENEDGDLKMTPWYNVHPLIRGVEQFKEAVTELEQEAKNEPGTD